MKRSILSAVLVASAAWAQSFEAASVKPGPPPRPDGRITVLVRGGPGTDDPTRAVFSNLAVANLVTLAFGIDFNHLSAPDWTQSERFIVEAKVPEGATKEQFSVMLRNLLIERFHLAYHTEKRDGATYDLVIAKNGPKFRGSTPDAPSPEATPPTPGREGPPQLSQEGFPILRNGRGTLIMGGHGHMHDPEETMDKLAGMLSGQLRTPVNNATGLTGKYDVDLHWVTSKRADAGDDDSGPSIFDAVQEQLGLRLQPKKAMIDMLVVDHIDKTPTEN